MHTLRNAKRLTQLVLVWFALFLGAAMASTVIQPENTQMVCVAGGGVKWVSMDDGAGDGERNASLGMDCPLCASVVLPLPQSSSGVTPSPLAHALTPLVAAHLAQATAPPLPSRGPPHFLR